jgi:esterase/lipase superfamily enzyme
MERRITSWSSPNVGMEMPVVAYGHAGRPLLMFPTWAADFLEYERFHLIDSVRHLVDAGRLRVYSINSINRYTLMNESADPRWKAALMSRFDSYLTDEVLPLIRHESGGAEPLTAGASMGAYLAANAYFRHPDLFAGTIPMSGSYDVRPWFNGYHDDNVYYNNPVEYLPNLDDDFFLPRLRQARAIVILSGQGSYEAPERSRQLSDILRSKGIPHTLDIWGPDVNHDWPWWRKMLPYWLERLL